MAYARFLFGGFKIKFLFSLYLFDYVCVVCVCLFGPVMHVNNTKKMSLFSAVLAHFILEENLHIFGVLGCVLCVVGSVTIVLHAPQERSIQSVKEVWQLATEPGI